VQAEFSCDPWLKAPGFINPQNLRRDILVSKFALQLDLYRYSEQLRALVRREARAKSALVSTLLGGGGGGGGAIGGVGLDGANDGLMSGPALATLIERSVKALNEGDFPCAGNVVDSFNRWGCISCTQLYP
jgi:hypothetical protein